MLEIAIIEEVLIPEGFLHLRDAVALLVKGMYAGFPSRNRFIKSSSSIKKHMSALGCGRKKRRRAFEPQPAMVSCRFS
jgi:hypothetical protein